MKKFGHTLLVVLLLAGCATSTVQSRKQERYAAYQALPPELKAAVDQGQVKVGMSMDAVYIAWGKPGQVSQSGNQNGEATDWSYLGFYTQETQFWGYRRMFYGYTTLTYPRAVVKFVNGVVVEWQTYPRSPY
jgi:hypothetical protein